MDIDGAKKEALNRIKQKGVDTLLLGAYLETKYYPSWAVNPNFSDHDWNIGLRSIASLELEHQIHNKTVQIKGVLAETEHTKFWIGASQVEHHSYAVDDSFSSQAIFLRIDDRPAIHARFYVGEDPVIPQNFKLYAVEEYHETDQLFALLHEVDDLIALKKQRQEEARKRADTEKYAGKFTFNDLDG